MNNERNILLNNKSSRKKIWKVRLIAEWKIFNNTFQERQF